MPTYYKIRVYLFDVFPESWSQKRWLALRLQYINHRMYEIINQQQGKSEIVRKYKDHLSYLESDVLQMMSLERMAAIGDISLDQHNEEIEFCITEDEINQQDDADPDEPFHLFEVLNEEDERYQSEEEVDAESTQTDHCKIVVKNECLEEVELNTKGKRQNKGERCEDTIFGELVTAMLLKMSPENKKRTKKEIMNILL